MRVRIAQFFVLVALVIGVTLSAENSVFDTPVSATNRDQMLEVCARIAKNEVVRGNFTQTKRITRLKRDFNSEGIFLFSSSLGIVWKVLKPQPSTVIITSDRLVQQVPGGKSSVMDGSSNAVFKRFADTMQSVFAGRIAGMERDFSVFFRSGSGASNDDWSIGLVPKEAVVRNVIQSMELKGDGFIRSLRIIEKNGDVDTYTFKDSRGGTTLSDDEKQLFIR